MCFRGLADRRQQQHDQHALSAALQWIPATPTATGAAAAATTTNATTTTRNGSGSAPAHLCPESTDETAANAGQRRRCRRSPAAAESEVRINCFLPGGAKDWRQGIAWSAIRAASDDHAWPGPRDLISDKHGIWIRLLNYQQCATE